MNAFFLERREHVATNVGQNWNMLHLHDGMDRVASAEPFASSRHVANAA
jgi:hypothetical protein